ncbi:unnamed protein product [Amoebophrya sp. A120]|nr:unnamed protein product [Amoebophrya sp. A120]|eukprot:GSA120T00018243001.1
MTSMSALLLIFQSVANELFLRGGADTDGNGEASALERKGWCMKNGKCAKYKNYTPFAPSEQEIGAAGGVEDQGHPHPDARGRENGQDEDRDETSFLDLELDQHKRGDGGMWASLCKCFKSCSGERNSDSDSSELGGMEIVVPGEEAIEREFCKTKVRALNNLTQVLTMLTNTSKKLSAEKVRYEGLKNRGEK